MTAIQGVAGVWRRSGEGTEDLLIGKAQNRVNVQVAMCDAGVMRV